EYTNGGEIEYEYLQEGLAVYVSQIRYDKNTIDFIYEERPDPIPVYYDGVKDKISKRLKEIVIKCNGSLYRKYEIKYEDQAYIEQLAKESFFSRIESVSESNSKGEHLNPTAFTWGVSSSSGMSENGVSSIVSTLLKIKGNNLISADINGDGISDLIARSNNWDVNTCVTTKKADGAISLSRHTNFTIENCESYTIADMDGDGKQSLVSLQISKGQATFKEHINGSMSRTVGLTSGKKPVFTAADLNNDGKDELIYIETAKNKDGKYKCGIFSNMSGLNNFYLSVWNGTPDGVIIRDFDGDGLKDMIITTEKGHFLYRNNGNGFASMFTGVSTSIYYSNGKEVLYTGDFNGDNLADILLYNPNSGSWCLYINQGRMIFSSKSLDALTNLKIKNEKFTHYDNDKEFCMVLDYDNDGKSDLLISDPRYRDASGWYENSYGRPTEHNIYWLRSTGEDFTTENSCKITAGEQLTAYFTMGDFDGDGSMDVMNWGYNCRTGDSSSKKLHLYKNSTHNNQSDKIVSVTNGLGRRDEIEYAPLSDESVYTPSASTEAKLMETRHLSVVKSITSNAGNSYRNKETFKYTGSRIHREGKGFMCFE
ncbi:MAG: VCBS repeat-containing protein, partial [Paludibacteraceae bacterium]|nr:VCBS repeat-containing protein [Paludibacteraceae bacterium]MBQ7747725.1 VCBS repeat-containing protein [Paludibacteraceae bacterium]